MTTADQSGFFPLKFPEGYANCRKLDFMRHEAQEPWLLAYGSCAILNLYLALPVQNVLVRSYNGLTRLTSVLFGCQFFSKANWYF